MYILLDSANQDNLINDNSIDIDDYVFLYSYNYKSTEDNQDDKPQTNKYHSLSEKNKSLLSRYLIMDIINRIKLLFILRKK